MIHQQVQFDSDDINEDSLCEGACVEFSLDDKQATNITPFPEVTIVTFICIMIIFLQAGPYLGVITKVANQKVVGDLTK